jgi:hypothetical protein
MFEIRQETSAGIFHVKLNREIDGTEIIALAQLAANIVSKIASTSISVLDDPTGVSGVSFLGQTKLGEKPVSSIKMGEYKEPSSGVRIRMLAFPEEHKMAAVKLFRDKTGLPVMTAKDILYGNHQCVILDPKIAEEIMRQFRQWNIYAKLEWVDTPGGVG